MSLHLIVRIKLVAKTMDLKLQRDRIVKSMVWKARLQFSTYLSD